VTSDRRAICISSSTPSFLHPLISNRLPYPLFSLLSSHRSSRLYLIPSQMGNITRIPDFAPTSSSAPSKLRQYVRRTIHHDIIPFIDPSPPNPSSPPLPSSARLLPSRAVAPSSPGASGALGHLAEARFFAIDDAKGFMLGAWSVGCWSR